MLKSQSNDEDQHASITAARSVMDAARSEAKRILIEAKQEQQNLKELAKAEISCQQAESTIQTLKKLETLRHQYLKENEGRLLEIALLLAEELVHEKILESPSSLKNRLQKTIRKLEPTPIISLQLSPTDYSNLKDEDWIIEFARDVQPSQRLAPGEALLQTPSSSVNLSMNLHLEQLREKLLLP